VAVNEPIDPRVRLAIAQWPDDAPRGAVSTFCAGLWGFPVIARPESGDVGDQLADDPSP
jgi:hypothetical protein